MKPSTTSARSTVSCWPSAFTLSISRIVYFVATSCNSSSIAALSGSCLKPLLQLRMASSSKPSSRAALQKRWCPFMKAGAKITQASASSPARAHCPNFMWHSARLAKARCWLGSSWMAAENSWRALSMSLALKASLPAARCLSARSAGVGDSTAAGLRCRGSSAASSVSSASSIGPAVPGRAGPPRRRRMANEKMGPGMLNFMLLIHAWCFGSIGRIPCRPDAELHCSMMFPVLRGERSNFSPSRTTASSSPG
mmetsp:Transcript_62420/g.201307  ORF Transcript_62420/g.201307 Transcript_62420/m.201307 type:complete len:253 (+) Transcript_62420:233-991(+)